jgi:hypothetical protein
MPAVRRQSADPLERYYSRPIFAAPLVRWLQMVAFGEVPSSPRSRAAAKAALDPMALAVEPCVGQGHLILGARQYGLRHARAPWRTLDLDPRARAAMWIGDWRQPPSSWQPRNDNAWARQIRLADELAVAPLVLTNPPFSIAIDVVEASWRLCPRAVVVVLQRQTWHEPTEDRADFFRQHPPDVITIGRCTFLGPDGRTIRGKNGKAGGGDSTSYALFVFGPDDGGNQQGLAGGMARIIDWRGWRDAA